MGFNTQQIYWVNHHLKTFGVSQGFDILERMIHKYPDTLEQIKIKDEKSKEYTIEEFLKIVSKLNLIRN